MTALLVKMERSSATLLGDNLDVGAVALLLATTQPGDGSEVGAINRRALAEQLYSQAARTAKL